MQAHYRLAVPRACQLAGVSRAGWYRRSVAKDQTVLRMRIRELAHARPRFGYQRIHVLLRREGWPVNKKRVRRLYRLEGLQLRMRRRKHLCLHRGTPPKATRAHERWSMDCVHDQLNDGRPFRILAIVDQWSRFNPALEPAFRFTGERVTTTLDQLVARTGIPLSITVDHGTEFTSRALEDWAHHHGVKLDFTHPGKPTENGHIESFNGRLRDECLNVEQFLSLDDAKRKLEAWREDYIHHRPHSSLGHLTPFEFVHRGQSNRISAAANL